MAAGIDGKIGLGVESAWGTGVVSTRFITAQESITEERGRLREPMVFGTRNTLPSDPGRLGITGGITEIHARPGSLGELFRATYGAPGAPTGTGPYIHTFAPQTAKHSALAAVPPYSATVTRGSLTHRYSGGQLNTMTLRQPAREALVVDTDWIFKDVETVTEETIALETDSRFLFRELAVTKGGSPFPYFEDLQIQINNNLDIEEVLDGTRVIGAVDFNDKLLITISGTLTFRDASTYADFAAGASDAYTFTWTKSANAALELTCPQLMIDDWSAPIGGPGRMTIDVSYTAEYDSGSGYALQTVLTNDVASY